MSINRPARSAQKLKIVRTPEGEVSGYLQCSVELGFGGPQTLVLEDSLPNVAISEVLNPLGESFLADEVQRLMRLGAAHWLVEEVGSAPMEITSRGDSTAWTVSFSLPLPGGQDVTLHVDVDDATTGREARSKALSLLTDWREGLNREPVSSELLVSISDLDLTAAPYLLRGLATLHA